MTPGSQHPSLSLDILHPTVAPSTSLSVSTKSSSSSHCCLIWYDLFVPINAFSLKMCYVGDLLSLDTVARLPNYALKNMVPQELYELANEEITKDCAWEKGQAKVLTAFKKKKINDIGTKNVLMKFTASTGWEIMSIQRKIGILQKKGWNSSGTKVGDKRTDYKVMQAGVKKNSCCMLETYYLQIIGWQWDTTIIQP